MFEESYIALRKKEGTLYTDEEVQLLPLISKDHLHYKEWQVRRRSAQRLRHYLKQFKKPLKILEVGCGNGWLSNHLAQLSGSTVTGIDINATELQQAVTVFGHQRNLKFIHGDIREGALSRGQFDIIVFAAAIHYFSSFSAIIGLTLQHLRANGEIHLIDSHFYTEKEASAAKLRTEKYYSAAAFPELSGFYFHHKFSDLHPFNYKVMLKPNYLRKILLRDNNPFSWISIKHH